MYDHIGKNYIRKDAPDKVHGRVWYTDDDRPAGLLFAAVKTSAIAHGLITGIDTEEALAMPGVRGVFTGNDFPVRVGLYLGDKSPLARDRVRYHGEPVAAVVAEYAHIPAILPEPGSNVSNRTKMRKGDVAAGFAEADVIIEGEYEFPPGDHVALEPRITIAEVKRDGRIILRTSTQSPYGVRAIMSATFGISPGMITVIAPTVGGGFGGKAGIQLEPPAYLLSRDTGGRPVRLANTREQDLVSSPGAPGLQSRVRLGALRDGTLVAAEIEYLFDSGGYADYAVNVSRAAAYSCTGPYRIPNVKADSLSVYTNHPFATAYRGFGHIEMSYSMERSMDILAEKLGIDPLDLRLKNAVVAGDTTPSQDILDANTGDLKECRRRRRPATDQGAGGSAASVSSGGSGGYRRSRLSSG